MGYTTLLRNASGNADDSQQFADLAVSLNLPLLRGAGMVARESLIQAERNLIYEVRDFERFRRQLLVDVASTYFDLLRQQREIVAREVQLEALQRLAERFSALAEAGREPLFEAERAEQQVLFGQSNLVNAIENYALSLDAFKVTLGMPTTQPIEILPVDIDVPTPKLNPTTAVTTALALRLDLQTSADQINDALRRVANARNGMLPDLDLAASANLPTDPDQDIAGLELDPGSGRYRVGVTLDLPLDRVNELASLRSSLVNLERSRRNDRLARDRVALDVRRNLRQISQARFNLNLQDRNVQLAERRVLGVQLRERQLGPREVIEAEEDLLEARLRRDSAVADLRQNILQFLLATGQMRVDTQGQWQPPLQLVPLPVEPAAEPEPENLLAP